MLNDEQVWLVLAVVVYPWAEELFFRGGLLELTGRLKFFISKPIFSNAAVSVIFSMAHLPLWGMQHAFLVFFPSMLLGVIYQKSRSWFLCGLVHSFFNFVYIVS